LIILAHTCFYNISLQHTMDWFRRLPTTVHHHIVFFLGEFVGTFLFLFFALSGTQVANVAAKAQLPPHGNSSEAPPNIASLLYISLAFGFSLGVNIWVFYRISGGLFNPAVSTSPPRIQFAH